MSMTRRKYNKRTLYDCDRCQFTYRKATLRKQRGMLLCDGCFDTVLEIEPLNLRLRSARANSTTTTAVNNGTVFTIGTAGVTSLSRSHVQTRQGVTKNFFMLVVGNPTTITANPQIVAASAGTILTLEGTNDTNVVVISTGNGTDLTSTMALKRGCSITLVYNTTSALWCEASRSIGGIV